MRKVSGFTIIELVVVITILGILSAVALPRFFGIQDEARAASAAGVAGAVAAASAINYGSRLAQDTFVSAGGLNFTVNACTNAVLAPLLTGGAFPTGISVAESAAGNLASMAGSGTAGLCAFFSPAGGAGTTVSIISLVN